MVLSDATIMIVEISEGSFIEENSKEGDEEESCYDGRKQSTDVRKNINQS